MNNILSLAIKISEKIRQEGGRALAVGGYVRDFLMGKSEIKDLDLEVYNISPDKLIRIVESFGKISLVGQSFGVIKIGDIDISIPRKEKKVNAGHKGFIVDSFPFLSFKEACRRRDLTINAILMDLLTGELIDPFNGREDLKNKIIRATDKERFAEDPLRVLRVMQFASRFQFSVEEETIKLCRSLSLAELPKERIYMEFEKWLVLSEKPSIGLRLMEPLGILKYFPEIESLKGCIQDSNWHPEGDVFEHTAHVLDEAAILKEGLDKKKQIILMFASLCHDMGKPETTEFIDGHYRSYSHDLIGEKRSRQFLERLTSEKEIIEEVVKLVKNHLIPLHYYNARKTIKEGTIRKLCREVDVNLLYLLAKADHLGRGVLCKDFPHGEWFLEKIKTLSLDKGLPPPLLMGRDLISIFNLTPGPIFKKILDRIYEMQLDGTIQDRDSALSLAHQLIKDLNL